MPTIAVTIVDQTVAVTQVGEIGPPGPTGSVSAATTIELGHPTDTTLARSSAGNITIEGNLVYRAGGTDVPITDGGTGASTAATGLANLGGVALTDLAASTGAALVGTVNTGTGAVTRTVQARMRDTVSAFDFIPVAEHAAIVAGTSTYNATTTLQAAIDTGKTVEFPEGTYQVVGLTMSTNGQRLVALGNVNLQKRANGVILSSSANNIELNGITFRGDAASPTFTGDNISLTGNSPRIINCGSLWASGRALKATGGNVVIHGSNPIWQTTDATASGYDIEVGVSGTASLYHEIHGYYSGQSTGGILFVDCGSQTIIGGEFGKLNISSGTSPSGVNGGKYVGARIVGNVTVGISNAVFTGNQFSNITFTIAAGVTGVTVDTSNVFAAGSTVTNNGSVSNIIQLDGGVGGQTAIKYGGSTSLAVVGYDPPTGDQYITNGYTRYAANRGVVFNGIANITANATNVTIINNTGSIFYGAAGSHDFFVSGTLYGTINTTGFRLPSGAALYNNSIKVVGAQGAAVADATDAASVIARLNDLLSRLRTHGLIAT